MQRQLERVVLFQKRHLFEQWWHTHLHIIIILSDSMLTLQWYVACAVSVVCQVSVMVVKSEY